MSEDNLKPRSVPMLKTFFENSGMTEAELYAAPVINPVSKILEEAAKDSRKKPEIKKAFKNKKGDTLFSLDTFSWYLLPVGKKDAYKLAVNGFSGNGEVFEVPLGHDLVSKTIGRLKINGKDAEYAVMGVFEKKGGFDVPQVEIIKPLTEDEKNTLSYYVFHHNISFIGLPDVRSIEQAFQSPSGDYLIVSCSQVDYSYDKLRMFKGDDLNNLREIPIKDVERLRDGGTTFYETDEGVLYSPFDREKKLPKWLPDPCLNDRMSAVENLKHLDNDKISEMINDFRIIGARKWTDITDGNKPGVSGLIPT